MSESAMLAAARNYVARGISVIPLYGPDEPAGEPVDKRGKRPAISRWKEFQDRYPTDVELVKWFGDGKRNIGLVTGEISGFTVVDFDTPEAIADARTKGLPSSPVVNTAKGLHAYCQYQEGHRNFQKRSDLPGVDLRAEGGYVVAPPSVHATGTAYLWREGRGLDTPLPPLPDWIFAATPSGKASIAELHTTTPEGRNISLTRLAGIWLHQHQGIDLAGLVEMGLEWSNGLPSPLPRDEVERTCKSIFDKHHLNNLPHGRHFTLKTGRDLRAMDIKIEWIVEGIIPRHSVVLLYGRGGIGKTTLMMMLANAIDRGEAIFNMTTVKTPVIIVDYENSLAVLSERAKRTFVDGVLFLDSGQDPPSLDKGDWTVYQALLEQYPGAVFVFDTLRSAHSGDENNSEVMTLIMRRMRQLRDAGATVILLHHTPKGNDRQFKGSGAILDLCDQTLALYQTAKPGSEKEAEEDDDDPNKVYRFGTGKKTRYKPHRVFLSFDTDKELFVMVKDPGDEALESLRGIICQLDEKAGAKQNEIVTAAAADKGFDFGGEKKIRALLKKGIGRFWMVEKGLHNATIYRPIQCGSVADPIGSEKLPSWKDPSFPLDNMSEKWPTEDTPPVGPYTAGGSLSDILCQTAKPLEMAFVDSDAIPSFTC